MCKCDEPHCQDGHFPLGMNEGGEVDWGGCPKCVVAGVHTCEKEA